MLASIPYRTYPIIELGPLQLRTFGLMVGIGVLIGSWVAATHGEKFGVDRDEMYRLCTRMVVFGVIGARLTWDITHWDQIDSPLDLIAVWEGGLQFSGGFIVSVISGMPTFLKWPRITRWRVLDGAAVGLAVGVAFGRAGCTSVGEHFGRVTTFPLAVRWDGGTPPDVREPLLGLGADAPAVTEGLVFHNTAIYEMVVVAVLVGVLLAVNRRRPVAGTLIGIYLLVYAPSRFLFDSMRVNDERVGGLTGAQWMCIAIVPIALWILAKVRPSVAAMEAAAADPPADVDGVDGPVTEPVPPSADRSDL